MLMLILGAILLAAAEREMRIKNLLHESKKESASFDISLEETRHLKRAKKFRVAGWIIIGYVVIGNILRVVLIWGAIGPPI